MHAFSRWVALATLVSGAAAYADAYDLQIENFGNPNAQGSTANADFQAFSRAFAATLTSTNLMPPETLGHSAFNVSAELSVVSLPGPDSVRIPTEQEGQPGSVLVPSVHVRKGLPFSVELGARVGWVEKSRMVAATGEVKWAVNEGFTYLPDIGVRAHVTQLMGVRDFSLTASGLDAGIGKQFPLGGMVTLTPYGGLDFTFVSGSSSRIAFPVDASTCAPQNQAAPRCDSTEVLLQNTASYERVRLKDNMNQRIYGGVRFIGGVLQLGAEISVTRLGNVKVDPSNPESETRGLPSIFTFNTSLGLDF
ncbi:hypothetical protein [Hyalangium rubrum]|uniref:Outer membrane protein beta-barrel domain-containing protein n=1 Tax=Hyalangium rubrum TaxID=3103134 RepID=A0ABU5H8L0_9BACT|nr:hypothetical protein [Hyalangium sp. s54d21]MDY7228430.1 hypothetical protein [Hyalangium sp. s54d21]